MTTRIVSFSDHPASNSGLARIHRDLAIRIHGLDGFEIATLGHGACGSTRLPFPQFQWKENDWFIPTELPFIIKDMEWEGDGPVILFTIGDIQRFLPLADPQFCYDEGFREWWKEQRREKRIKLWGYFPIDAHGIGGKLPPQLAHTLTHYDRILVPSEWAKSIAEKTIPDIKVTAIPHGIDTEVFKPTPKQEAREKIGEVVDHVLQWPKQAIDVDDKALWIGIVATNQWRKDWGLGIEVAAELKKSRPVFLWCHTDRLKREWSILELLSDFGLLQSSMVTVGNIPDSSMAIAYSAMDLTLGIGRGEGFGYPIMESKVCGTPCFAFEYGSHAEWLPWHKLFEPEIMRIEGPLNLMRPVGVASKWATGIVETLNEEPTELPDELFWENLWPRFEKWLREGE